MVAIGCRTGGGEAQKKLGSIYISGEGVEQNDKEAARWILLAAEQNDTSSQNVMGH